MLQLLQVPGNDECDILDPCGVIVDHVLQSKGPMALLG